MKAQQVSARTYAGDVQVRVTGEDRRQVQHAKQTLESAIDVALNQLERRYPMLDFTTDF